MLKHKNKLALTFLLLAVFSFVLVSVGGEYLHGIIHHHEDQCSHDECSISQLLVQVFTVQTAVILALSFLLVTYLKRICQSVVFRTCCNLPYSHAPPVSL